MSQVPISNAADELQWRLDLDEEIEMHCVQLIDWERSAYCMIRFISGQQERSMRLAVLRIVGCDRNAR